MGWGGWAWRGCTKFPPRRCSSMGASPHARSGSSYLTYIMDLVLYDTIWFSLLHTTLRALATTQQTGLLLKLCTMDLNTTAMDLICTLYVNDCNYSTLHINTYNTLHYILTFATTPHYISILETTLHYILILTTTPHCMLILATALQPRP